MKLLLEVKIQRWVTDMIDWRKREVWENNIFVHHRKQKSTKKNIFHFPIFHLATKRAQGILIGGKYKKNLTFYKEIQHFYGNERLLTWLSIFVSRYRKLEIIDKIFSGTENF